MTTRIKITHQGPNYHKVSIVSENSAVRQLAEAEHQELYVYDTNSVFAHEATVDTEVALEHLLASVRRKKTEGA